ncbi:MAG: DNA repair protein RecN [Candidatus Thiodiazotropha sp. (ex Monitilora ramsayi)]|nr:DNA repair protein RecN [Candidatus Thiodiazotropha sp. (ex Monitilora ramsayi)]
MLTDLQIRDLAVVSSLELELLSGLTALTGETGAGKSILIDALGLALGERADKSMIRAGSERAEVTAVFDITGHSAVTAWLESEALDETGECILRRSLNREGRSRAFINGRAVPLQQMQTLGDMLVEIHGQHAHQSLLKRHHQRHLLDAYGGYLPLAEETSRQFKEYQTSQADLDQRTAAASDRASRLDLLNYQQHELASLDLTVDELEDVGQEHRRLSHLDQLRNQCSDIINGLDEAEPSLRSQLARYAEQLNAMQALDDSLNEPHEMLTGALIQVDESLTFLRGYLNEQEIDPSALQQLEERLEAIHDCARKYRVPPQQLPERLEEIELELSQLKNADVELAALEQQVASQHKAYLEWAGKLSQARGEAAKRLGKEISEAMQKLGMSGGVFAVDLTPLADEKVGAHGLEQVEFKVSANPGMPLQPLNKVASGGELSRISLAIQVATIRYGSTPTLVFDEVDVGIGGGVAEVVGQMLRTLGDSRQILCVTHLPQVAAQAMHHLSVTKQSSKEETRTSIAHLHTGDRIEEIARMLGGVKITQQTLAHAKEMVDMAASR